MYCHCVFQIISDSWRKQHFKLFWQISRGNHTRVCGHIHTSTQSTIDGKQSSSATLVTQRKVRFTNQFTGHHFPPVIEVRGWTLHGATCHLDQERNKKWCKPISLDRRDTDGDNVQTILSAPRSSLKPLAIIMMEQKLFISPQFSDVAKTILQQGPEFSYERSCCPWEETPQWQNIFGLEK